MKVYEFTFLCLSLIFLSDSAAFLFICSSVLMKFRLKFFQFVRINECSFVNQLKLKIAGVSLVGHLWYFMGLSCKVRFPWRRRPSGLTKQPAEGR
jgi:hypothetical protein